MRSCRELFGADLNHLIISSWVIFSILGPLSALGSPHAAKQFIGLAIGVRTKSRGLALAHNFLFTMRNGTTRAQQRIMAKLFSARSGIDAFPLNLMDRWAEPPKASLLP